MALCPRHPAARGAALIEAMVALSVLLVGLLGMFQLQVIGIFSNDAARMQMRALAYAQDLVAAMERQPIRSPAGALDPVFSVTVNSSTSPAPAPFGSLLQPPDTVVTGTGIHDGTIDSNLPAGAILNGAIERDPVDPANPPLFQRRWTVWEYAPSGSTFPSRIIAVSVTWREGRGRRSRREVVVYTQKLDPAGIITSLVSVGT